ncbi:uncharacterized protein si:ch211-159e12.5 [Trichomycterus rosablanca]|uniref:uncharacterized protein si:ch211-159e12.5 n=1 Tax=Trichomycterus rosablanca TaxID=2290929 RepID=UPI002F353B97
MMELCDGRQKFHKYSTFPGWSFSSQTGRTGVPGGRTIPGSKTRGTIRNDVDVTVRVPPSSESRLSPEFTAQNVLIQKEKNMKEKTWDWVNTWQPKHYRRDPIAGSDCYQEVGGWAGGFYHSVPRRKHDGDGGMWRETMFMPNIQKVPGSVGRFLHEDPYKSRVVRKPPPPYPGNWGSSRNKNGRVISSPHFGRPPNYTLPPPYSSQSKPAKPFDPDTQMKSGFGTRPDTDDLLSSSRDQTPYHQAYEPSQLQLQQTYPDRSHRVPEQIQTSCHEKSLSNPREPRRRGGGTVFCLISRVGDPANISSSSAKENNRKQTQPVDRVTPGEDTKLHRSVMSPHSDQTPKGTSEEHQNQIVPCLDTYKKVQDVGRMKDEDPTETFPLWKKHRAPSENQYEQTESNLSDATIRRKKQTLVFIDATSVAVTVQHVNPGPTIMSGRDPDSQSCTVQKLCPINPEDLIHQGSPQGSNGSAAKQTGPVSGHVPSSKVIQRAERIPGRPFHDHRNRQDELQTTEESESLFRGGSENAPVLIPREEKLQIKANAQDMSTVLEVDHVMVPKQTNHEGKVNSVKRKPTLDDQFSTKLENNQLRLSTEAEVCDSAIDDQWNRYTNPSDDHKVTGSPKEDNKDHPNLTSPVRSLGNIHLQHPSFSGGHVCQESSIRGDETDNILNPDVVNINESYGSGNHLQKSISSNSRLQVSHLVQLFSRDGVKNRTKVSGEENPSNAKNINSHCSAFIGDLLWQEGRTRKDEVLVETRDLHVGPVENTTNKMIPQDEKLLNKEDDVLHLYHRLSGEDELENHCSTALENPVVNTTEWFHQQGSPQEDTEEDEAGPSSPFNEGHSKINKTACLQNPCSTLSSRSVNKVTPGFGRDGSTTQGESPNVKQEGRPSVDVSLNKVKDKQNLCPCSSSDPDAPQKSSSSSSVPSDRVKSSHSVSQISDVHHRVRPPAPSTALKYNRAKRCPRILCDAVSRIRRHTAPDSENEEEEGVEIRTTEDVWLLEERGGSCGGDLSQNVFISSGEEDENPSGRAEESDDTQSNSSVDSQDSTDTVIQGESRMKERAEESELFSQN